MVLVAPRRAPRLAGAHPAGAKPSPQPFTGLGFFRMLIALSLSHPCIRVLVGPWGWLEPPELGVSNLKSQRQFYRWCSVKFNGCCQDFVTVRPRLETCEPGVLKSKTQGLALELAPGPMSLAF